MQSIEAADRYSYTHTMSDAAAQDLESTVREVLVAMGRLAVDPLGLGLDDDLFNAGLTSQAAVELVFGLEDRLDGEVSDAAITRHNLSTIRGLMSMFSPPSTTP